MEKLKYNDSINEKLKYNNVIYKNIEISNILYIIDRLDKAPIANSKLNNWDKFQMLITMLSNDPSNERFKEMYNEHQIRKNRKFGKQVDSILRLAPYYSNEKAIDKIKLLAKETQAVMLNECHWCPSHRISALKLLEPLKKEGYTYLAIEAVSKGEENLINQKSYPLKYSGIYTKEPYFGMFIREAKRLGYEIVSYDFGFSTIKDREKSQADNIANIFKADSTAKMFIYAGGDHIIEKGDSRKWMAEYFSEITGIDPLTIDQVEISIDTNENMVLGESNLFRHIDGLNSNVDYFLINNIQPDLKEIFSSKDLSKYTLNLQNVKKDKNEELFVTIFYLSEYENDGFRAVPILNRITKENELDILLPNYQNFRIKVFNKANNIILTQSIFNEP